MTEENTQDTSNESASQQTTNPIEQLLHLLALVDPIELAGKAVDTTRRTTETLVTVLENFASTIDNLNRTTTRVNALMDEIEEPLKRVMPQLGNAMNAMATMGEAATQLAELSKRLGPLTTLAENAGGLFGFRPGKPSSGTTSSSPQTES